MIIDHDHANSARYFAISHFDRILRTYDYEYD